MSEKEYYFFHRKRLRERYLNAGIDGFADYEILELVLTYSVPRKDVKPLAKKLIDRFGSLASVLDAERSELLKVKGIGDISAIHIKLIKDICSGYLGEKMVSSDVMSNPGAVYNFSRSKIGGKSVELFMIIFVNAKNEVTGYEIIGEGSIDNVAVYPRKIIKSAIERNASGLILVHNHPSGHPEPSESDRELTREIVSASRSLELRVLDHLVVTRNDYYSFMDSGLI